MSSRLLKASICDSGTIAALPDWGAEVLFYRLMVGCCDDFGRFDARPAIVRAHCFPLALDRVSLSDVGDWLRMLAEVGLIQFYTADGREYGVMTKWMNHQRLRNKRSRFPEPPVSNLLSIDRDSPQSAASRGLNPNPNPNPKKNLNLNLKNCADDSESPPPSSNKSSSTPRTRTFRERLVDGCLMAFGKRYAVTRGQEYPGGLPALREAGFGIVTKRLKTLCPDVPYRKADEAGKTAEQLETACKDALKVWSGYLDRAAQIDATARGIPGKDGDWLRFPDTPAKFCGRIPKLTSADVDAARKRAADVAEAKKNSKRMNPDSAPTVRYGEFKRAY